MSEEKFDAKVDKVSGSVKESVGKLTGCLLYTSDAADE